MPLVAVCIIGAIGGLAWFLFSEFSRKRRVVDRLRVIDGLTEDAFAAAQPDVDDFVARSVYRYFHQLGRGIGVDPGSDLIDTYELDGNLLEGCLNEMQSALGIRKDGFARARASQGEGVRTVRDLVEFIDLAVRHSR